MVAVPVCAIIKKADALARKPKAGRIADLRSKWFVAAVTLAAAATGFGTYYVLGDMDAALTRAAAVMIIACPCALALATPIAVLAGISAAARRRILLRGGEQFLVGGWTPATGDGGLALEVAMLTEPLVGRSSRLI